MQLQGQDQLPFGPRSTSRNLSRAESLRLAGLTEETADQGLFVGGVVPVQGLFRDGRARTQAVAQNQVTTYGGDPLSRITPGLVDIYLSAGPVVRDADGVIVHACNNEHMGNCTLWRIRWDFATSTVVDWEAVAEAEVVSGCEGGRGNIEPGVSPDGTRIAWVRPCLGADGQVIQQSMVAREVAGGTPAVVATGAAGGQRPQYPNWYQDHLLLFDRNSTGSAPENWMVTLWGAGSWPDFLGSGALLGPGGIYRTEEAFEDPHTHASPQDRPMAYGPRVVTFGGGLGERVPRVTDILGGEEEVINLPTSWGQGNDKPECHHPAWSPGGGQILCTRYKLPETLTPEAFPLRRLYVSRWTGTEWPEPEALVGLLTADEFNQTSKEIDQLTTINVFQTESGAGERYCGTYHWKFAEWCGYERYVVATLYCTEATLDPEPPTLSSRVMLIDLTMDDPDDGDPSAYIDLVSFLEEHNDAGYGTWSGIFATCARVAEFNLPLPVIGTPEFP